MPGAARTRPPTPPVQAPRTGLSRGSLRLLVCVAGRTTISHDDFERLCRALDVNDEAGDDVCTVLTRTPVLVEGLRMATVRELLGQIGDPERALSLAHLVAGGDALLTDAQRRALDTPLPVRETAMGLCLGRRRDGRTQEAYQRALRLAEQPQERLRLAAFVDVDRAVVKLREALEAVAPRRLFEAARLPTFARAALDAWDALAARGDEILIVRDITGAPHRAFVRTRSNKGVLAEALGLGPAELRASEIHYDAITASAAVDARHGAPSHPRALLRRLAAPQARRRR